MCRAAWIVVFAGACAATPPPLAPEDFDVDVGDAPWQGADGDAAASGERRFHDASYHITWQGKRIGHAREVFQRTDAGVRLIREERLRVRRGGEPVASALTIVIDADEQLRARRVELRSMSGAVERSGRATRADDGSWVLALDGEPVRTAPADAVPIELVPFLAAAGGGRYRARVFLPGYGFAVSELELKRRGRRAVATLSTPWGDVETAFGLDRDGALVRAVTGQTSALRVEDSRLDEPFEAPELLGDSAIPVSGSGTRLVLERSRSAQPLTDLGQSATLRSGSWWVQFADPPAIGAERTRVIAALSRRVNDMLIDAHDAPGADARAARDLGRGDCTAHATLFAELAGEQGIETRLVTGYRIDGDRLVRHRWAAIRAGEQWVSVDPTFDEAPAPSGRHLALAIHGASVSELSLVDEVVFKGLTRATASWR